MVELLMECGLTREFWLLSRSSLLDEQRLTPFPSRPPLLSYDSCDVGTVVRLISPAEPQPFSADSPFIPSSVLKSNQSLAGVPAIASTGNKWGTELSFLPGQRLSRCTCTDDETHPGPKHTDGTWVGRSAPEVRFLARPPSLSLSESLISALFSSVDRSLRGSGRQLSRARSSLAGEFADSCRPSSHLFSASSLSSLLTPPVFSLLLSTCSLAVWPVRSL